MTATKDVVTMTPEGTLDKAVTCLKEYIEKRCSNIPLVASQGFFSAVPAEDETPLLRLRVTEWALSETPNPEFPEHRDLAVRGVVVGYWASGQGDPTKGIPANVTRERGTAYIDVEAGRDGMLKNVNGIDHASYSVAGNTATRAYGGALPGGVQCAALEVLLSFTLANGDETDNAVPLSMQVTKAEQEKAKAEARQRAVEKGIGYTRPNGYRDREGA